MTAPDYQYFVLFGIDRRFQIKDKLLDFLFYHRLVYQKPNHPTGGDKFPLNLLLLVGHTGLEGNWPTRSNPAPLILSLFIRSWIKNHILGDPRFQGHQEIQSVIDVTTA
jgi:hypothetical protein